MNTQQSLQDRFLLCLKQQQDSVSIFLVNGIKLHGVIDDIDDSVIMLKNSITQMIYKHSISTVVPSRLIEMGSSDTGENVAN